MSTRSRIAELSHLPVKVIAAQVGISQSMTYRYLNNCYGRCVIEGEINGKVVVSDSILCSEIRYRKVLYRAYLISMSFGLPWAIFIRKSGQFRVASHLDDYQLNKKMVERFKKIEDHE